MEIREKPIGWYINQLDEPFSFPGYSDSEWFCMIGEREGERSGQGQLHTKRVAPYLISSLCHSGENFLPAFPKILMNLPQWPAIKIFIDRKIQRDVWYERDMVTDTLAENAGLFPFIQALKERDVYIVGNKHLKGLDFLNYKRFYTVSEKDAHLDMKRLTEIVSEILKRQERGVYLFSAGIASAMMIGELHGRIEATLFDCGSSFDAFVGIGGQREWRANLYKDSEALEAWKHKNLHGVS